ncbi:MAG: hypothetical protein U0V02_07335 [Anaerolineales bacterium]
MSQINLNFIPYDRSARLLLTRHFTMEEVIYAYSTFDRAMKVEALKVIVTNEIMMEKSIQAMDKDTIPFPVRVLPQNSAK